VLDRSMSENGAGAKSSKCDIAQKIKVIQALIIQNPVPLDELRSLVRTYKATASCANLPCPLRPDFIKQCSLPHLTFTS
jgi:hypothetical protein